MKEQWIKDIDGQEFIGDIKTFEKNIRKDNIVMPEIIITEDDDKISFTTPKSSKLYTSHCVQCGKELIGKPNGVFSARTGIEDMNYYCPSLLCGHYGISHERQTRKLFITYCVKCNKKNFNSYISVVMGLIILAVATSLIFYI